MTQFDQLLNVPRQTLQRDLKKLLDASILVAAGHTINMHYCMKEGEL